MLTKLDCHAETHIGISREENEDQFLIADLVKAARIQKTSLNYDDQVEVSGHSHGKVMLVADGMGGHAAGRRASTLAVDQMINYMVNRMRWQSLQLENGDSADQELLDADLKNALRTCQQRIRRESNADHSKRSMGTTLTVAIIDWPTAHIVHVGDSRCYLFRKGETNLLTKDHTVAQAFVDSGRMTEAEAEDSRFNNALWNVVGGPVPDLQPEVLHVELQHGDTLLLCTDGLTKHVTDSQISNEIQSGSAAATTCNRLIDRANANGGSDNITVAIARFHKPTTELQLHDTEEIVIEEDKTPRQEAKPIVTGERQLVAEMKTK